MTHCWWVVIAALMTLTACNRIDHRPEDGARGPRTLHRLTPDDAFPDYLTDNFVYGGEAPPMPVGGFTHGQWRKWAHKAWPEACRLVQARNVRGRVLEGRTCTVLDVRGIDPVQYMRSSGFLDVEGVKIPVIWSWSRSALQEGRSCALDPVGEETSDVLLTRSSSLRNWQLSNIAGKNHFLDTDGVWDTCQNLEALFQRQS